LGEEKEMNSDPQTLEELVAYLKQRSAENQDHAREAHDEGTRAWHGGKSAAYASAAYKVSKMIPPEYPKAICLPGLVHGVGIGYGCVCYRADSYEHEQQIYADHAAEQERINKELSKIQDYILY
jgi:hypothetical protein